MASAGEHLAKAQRFLATARLAMDDGDLDSGVSRAEYAVHHAMIALLLRNSAAPRTERASKAAIQTGFASLAARSYPEISRLRFDPESKSLRRSLDDLSSLRNRADYGVDEVSGRRASTALRFATRIVESVEGAFT